jgi:hypothetical protein
LPLINEFPLFLTNYLEKYWGKTSTKRKVLENCVGDFLSFPSEADK